MKSTIRVALQGQGNDLKPVIRIIQPSEIIDSPPNYINEDEDPKDQLISTFLQSPCNANRNNWFTLGTHYPVPMLGVPTHYVTNIEAPTEMDLFSKFKYAIIGRVIPYADIVRINRGQIPILNQETQHTRPAESMDMSVEKHKIIESFFEWLEKTDRCSWEEQQPDGSQLK